MKDLFSFNEVDKRMWMGIGAVVAVMVLLLSIFTTTSAFYYFERLAIAIVEMFIPGYIITKLFADKLEFTEYPSIDKFLVSLFFSISTVQTLYFFLERMRFEGLNTDEGVNSNKLVIFVVFLVIGSAIGLRIYLNKRKALDADADDQAS